MDKCRENLNSNIKFESAPKSLKKHLLAKAVCIHHLNCHDLKVVAIDNQLLAGL